MGKHTAGKWSVSSSILVCSEDGKVIANCLPMVEIAELSIGIEESSSNAALISAAPDLLQALEGAQKALRVAMPFMPADKEAHFIGEWLDAVNAAIARARGQIGPEDDDPFCECGNDPMEDELASNKCDACGKELS